MKKITPFVKKYLPDGLVLFGILIFSYNLLRPITHTCKGLCNRFDGLGGYTNYHTNYKVLGILLFTLGIIWAIRRYLALKKVRNKLNS